MYLQEIEVKLDELHAEKDSLRQYFINAENEIDKKITAARLIRDLLLQNISIEKIEIAKKLISIRGINWVGSGETYSAIDDAIKDFINGVVFLRKNYIGCKNYDGFTCQRSDHMYGYGPKHGSMVFMIILEDHNSGHVYTEEEIDACIYVLRILRNKEAREALLKVGVNFGPGY